MLFPRALEAKSVDSQDAFSQSVPEVERVTYRFFIIKKEVQLLAYSLRVNGMCFNLLLYLIYNITKCFVWKINNSFRNNPIALVLLKTCNYVEVYQCHIYCSFFLYDDWLYFINVWNGLKNTNMKIWVFWKFEMFHKSIIVIHYRLK